MFWIASVNTGLGTWSTAAILFPIAWVEMIIGAWIASKLYSKKDQRIIEELKHVNASATNQLIKGVELKLDQFLKN